MKKLRAFLFQLKINSRQSTEMLKVVGCKRLVYNKALSLQVERRRLGLKLLSYADLCKLLTLWRHADETKFLAEAPIHPLQQALKDLERAFTNFFAGRAKFPRFKKKGVGDSFRYPDPKQFKIDGANGRIFLPKLGWHRYRKSRKVDGRAKQVTVSKSRGHWFVSIQTEQDVDTPQPESNSTIGIDLGVKVFATLSDGTTYAPNKAYSKYEKKIAREQRNLSRKIKFSGKWFQQVKKIQNLYHHVFNKRLDFHHKTSTTICKNHALVIVEDLNVKGMSASAKGTVEHPGKNVKAKSGLNRSILNQGWSAFVVQLKYKVEGAGGMFLAIPPRNTSNRCSHCGYIAKENRRTQSKFACLQCDHSENADLNAARNIHAAGLAVLASGEGAGALSLKLEPTVSMNTRKSFVQSESPCFS